MKTDVVVIGSGLGGLECARLLSAHGLRVVVLERGSQPGGCMQSFMRHGLHYDTGLHYVGGLAPGQSLYAPFSILGLLDLPWLRLDSDGFDRVTIGGITYNLAEGFDNFVDTLADRFPQEREALRRYTAMLSESDRHQWDALSPDAGGQPPRLDALATGAWDWLNSNFTDSKLIDIVSGNAMRLELRRSSLPLFTFAHSNGSFIESSWRLRGSGNILVAKLVDGITSHGGSVVYKTQVSQLVERDGRIVAARTADGTEYEADTFISDIHPAQTIAMVAESSVIKRIYRRRITSLDNTFGMLTVQLALKPDTVEYFNHNHFVYSRPDVWQFCEHPAEGGGVMVSCRVPEDGGRFASQIDLLTPMLWSDCSRWTDTSVGRRGEDYEAMKQSKAADCVALAEQVVPGLSAAIERQYVSTPLTYRDYTLTPMGSAFGIRKDYRQPLLTTLSPRTPISNLLITGQSVMLHGVQGVTMTALLTCAEILGKDTIWNQIKKVQ